MLAQNSMILKSRHLCALETSHACLQFILLYVTMCQTLMKEWGYDADQADMTYNFIELIFYWSDGN